ncbi:hypothetical protein NQ318_020429 [Aromia moschata]|uniref:Uncharacterized protein n=1 Tax=Aromia moschata TaxID=1265417 RepID=A0AAV8YJT4_9CUCU|nr:hypothetical protein NQ318_020429 [Aromia moschata]
MRFSSNLGGRGKWVDFSRKYIRPYSKYSVLKWKIALLRNEKLGWIYEKRDAISNKNKNNVNSLKSHNMKI